MFSNLADRNPLRIPTMSTPFPNATEPTTTTLVGGIIEDVQDLVKQQLQLTRQEIVADFRKAKEATCFYAAGLGIAFLGGIVLCFALSHVLHWAASPPATDPAWLPLWACHAIVGSVLAILGGALLWGGERKRQSINPMESAAGEALKQNVEFATHPITPPRR
jgi:Putative Actinobacterial Holin-X, holin superfamily III